MSTDYAITSHKMDGTVFPLSAIYGRLDQTSGVATPGHDFATAALCRKCRSQSMCDSYVRGASSSIAEAAGGHRPAELPQHHTNCAGCATCATDSPDTDQADSMECGCASTVEATSDTTTSSSSCSSLSGFRAHAGRLCSQPAAATSHSDTTMSLASCSAPPCIRSNSTTSALTSRQQGWSESSVASSSSLAMAVAHPAGRKVEEAVRPRVAWARVWDAEPQPQPQPQLQPKPRTPPAYADHSSPAALARANGLLSKNLLPGQLHFTCVPPSSLLFHLGTTWGFTAYSICLGSSYFQRLVSTNPTLQWAVRADVRFAAYVPHNNLLELQGPAPPAATSSSSNVLGVLFTCVYLATKTVDRLPYGRMLEYMLGKLYGFEVPYSFAYDAECRCLDGLRWRLGPYFHQDVLIEEL